MSIQMLPNEMLVRILGWVPLNDLRRTSQVSKEWKEVSCCDAVASCTVLTQEIDLYLSHTQEIFQKSLDNLTASNANAKKQAAQQQQTLQSLNQKMEEEPELSADERQSIEDQIQTLETSSRKWVDLIKATEKTLADISKKNENFLSKVNAHPCDDLICFTRYSKLFNKKIMLLSELFNFCIFSTEKDEWESNIPNVNYLPLLQSKMIEQDLVAKKIKNFEECINPVFTSEESFSKFEQLSKFHQLMDSDEKTIPYIQIKNFIENRLESLKTGSPNLTTLSFDFTPLILRVPFLIEQPDKMQYKGCPMQPPLKFQLNTILLSGGVVPLDTSVINAGADEITSRGIYKGIRRDSGNPFEFTNTSVVMHIIFGENDQLIPGKGYKIRINLGSFVIISREFIFLDHL